MTEEQFKILCELLKKILEKLETIDGDVSSLCDCVESQLSSIRVYPVTYRVSEDD